MRRKLFLTLSALLVSLTSFSQGTGTFDSEIPATSEDSPIIALSSESDTVLVKHVLKLNNYSTIGIEVGGVANNMLFNPPRSTKFVTKFPAFAVMFTHYQKMFGYMPYFGYQVGIAHSYQGFKFKKETYIDGQTSAQWKFLEVPFMAMMHYDMQNLKLMANLGIYGGWRYDITREGPYVEESIIHSFRDFDHQIDYGFTGGIGAALVFEPFEFVIQGRVRYSLGSLYEPDYMSPYYYRFAYPLDIVVTAGVHIQIGRRTGKTSAEIRREAYDAVYNANIPKQE